jgi:cardiolipin synthase
MDEGMVNAILSGEEKDHLGLGWKLAGAQWSGQVGLLLLWVAAALTLITGIDYFRKSIPYLKDND